MPKSRIRYHRNLRQNIVPLLWRSNKYGLDINHIIIINTIMFSFFQFWEVIAGEHGILPNGKYDTSGKLFAQ